MNFECLTSKIREVYIYCKIIFFRNQNTRCLAYETEDFEVDESSSNDTNVGASTSSGITHENYTERKIIKSTENVPKWFKP